MAASNWAASASFVLAEGDYVETGRDRLAGELQLGVELGVALGVLHGDRQIEQHGVELILFQVFVRRGLVCRRCDKAMPICVEQPRGGRVAERADDECRPACNRRAIGNGFRRGGQQVASVKT